MAAGSVEAAADDGAGRLLSRFAAVVGRVLPLVGTLGLPASATHALADLQRREGRSSGPKFATRDGGDLDATNIRREFRARS